jgi:hypothetical protein
VAAEGGGDTSESGAGGDLRRSREAAEIDARSESKGCGLMRQLIFVVEEAPEGGYTARALGESIFTEAEPSKNYRLGYAMPCAAILTIVSRLEKSEFVRPADIQSYLHANLECIQSPADRKFADRETYYSDASDRILGFFQ